MAYLQPADYSNYGLPEGTTADWIVGASALINNYCRRQDLNVVEYTERMRLTDGSQTVLLTYLPLAPLGAAASPLVSVKGRLARQRRGEISPAPLIEIAQAFALPGQWMDLDVLQMDFDVNTGELTLPWNIFGLPFNEVEVVYTAGLTVIGDDVKAACAQIVRNAQATPALNASMSRLDTMEMKYFSSSLLDETVKAWLNPYVMNRLG